MPTQIKNVFSLFDGISCGQLALQRAGIEYENYFASEIDKNAIKVTQTNFPNTIQLGDVTKLCAQNLPQIDLLLAGSPCQGFSSAGRRLNFDCAKSKLFFEFVRLLKETNPKYFLLENVKMKKEWQDIISDYLGVQPIIINSALVSAQNRNRAYWTNIPNVGQPEDKNISLEDVVNESNIKGGAIRSWPRDKPNMDRTKTIRRIEIRDDNKANCLTTKKSHYTSIIVYSQNNEWREFTIEEFEKLQTLPVGYTNVGISITQRVRCIGNCWTVDVATHILKNINLN